MATQTPFFSVTGKVANYASPAVDTLNQAFSIQINVSGTYNADAKLQSSLDGVNWVDLTGSEELAFSGDPESILFDVTTGFHRFARIFITRNSGTFDIEGFISNSFWKSI